MKSLAELLKATDEELIDMVATKVMKWEKEKSRFFGKREAWVHGVYKCSQTPKAYSKPMVASISWDPLTNWNHTMQVVLVFQDKLFSGRKKFRENWQIAAGGVCMSEALTHLNQKELCIAALLSVE